MPPVLAEQQFEAAPKEAFAAPGLQLIPGGSETTPPTGLLEQTPRSREDHMLSDVDDLARYVSHDGLSYDPVAVASVRQNKKTAVLEGAMPDAVSVVRQEWVPSPEGRRGGLIMALGRTAVETAARGESWYRYDESKARGKVEVKHAIYNQENLRPGVALIKIAAKMSREDGSLEIAKAEGVADADSIQMDWLDWDSESQSGEAVTECILAQDVPTEAWVDMLADPNNIFNQSIAVRSRHSGLAIMEAYEGMEVPLSELPEGPITILASVIPYIKDPAAREKVAEHVQRFRNTDQAELHKRAESPTERLLQFDMSTEQSLRAGIANEDLRRFIESLKDNWGDKDRTIIEEHRSYGGHYAMTRELAAVLQNAQRNMILSAAAVVAGNQAVLDQLSEQTARAIYSHEMAIQTAHRSGMDVRILQGGMHQLIARQNIKVGGGCNGDNEAGFKTLESTAAGLTETTGETAGGTDQFGSLTFKCQVGHVNTRPRGKLIPCCTTCGVSVKC